MMTKERIDPKAGGRKLSSTTSNNDAEQQLDDGIPAGWCVRRWHARTGQKLTEAEVAAHRAKVRAQQAQREAELEKEDVRTAARHKSEADSTAICLGRRYGLALPPAQAIAALFGFGRALG